MIRAAMTGTTNIEPTVSRSLAGGFFVSQFWSPEPMCPSAFGVCSGGRFYSENQLPTS